MVAIRMSKHDYYCIIFKEGHPTIPCNIIITLLFEMENSWKKYIPRQAHIRQVYEKNIGFFRVLMGVSFKPPGPSACTCNLSGFQSALVDSIILCILLDIQIVFVLTHPTFFLFCYSYIFQSIFLFFTFQSLNLLTSVCIITLTILYFE